MDLNYNFHLKLFLSNHFEKFNFNFHEFNGFSDAFKDKVYTLFMLYFWILQNILVFGVFSNSLMSFQTILIPWETVSKAIISGFYNTKHLLYSFIVNHSLRRLCQLCEHFSSRYLSYSSKVYIKYAFIRR